MPTTKSKRPAGSRSKIGKSAGDSTIERSLARISKLIDKFESQMTGNEFKMTVADYIRLLQLKLESEADTQRDIEVSWVDMLNDPNGAEE